MLFRNGKREEVGGEAKGKMDGLESMIIYIQQRIIINLPVNPNITLFIFIRGFRSPSKTSSLIKPKFKAHGFYEVLQAYKSILILVWATSIGFTEKLSIEYHHKGHIVRQPAKMLPSILSKHCMCTFLFC